MPAHTLRRSATIVDALESRTLFAFTLKLDYSLDASGFFSDPARKAVMQQAATLMQGRIADTLSAVVPSGSNTWTLDVRNPATGNVTTINNPTIPADTIVVYVGGRELGGTTLGVGGRAGWGGSGTQSWLDVLRARGESGALASTKTDYAPHAGSVAFDVTTPWFFGSTTSGLTTSKSDFLSVAVHERGHVLGFTDSTPSFQALISGNTLVGPKSKAANGGAAVPLNPENAHWAEGTKSGGVETAMDPTLTRGTRKLFTPLDWAGLDDIGWEITAATPPATASVAGNVFKDLDGDGIKDTGEGALAGVRVYLDADKDGVFDSTEKTVTTDSAGNYKFTGLAAGSVRVRIISPSGYRTTAPSAGYHDVTLTAGQAVTGKNLAATQKAKLTGQLFNDLDGDGVKDSGEGAMSNIRVFLDADKDGIYDTGETSTMTDASGNYTFTLSAGTYRVKSMIGGSAYRVTTPASGYADVTLASGQIVTGKHFGFTLKVLISGNVFRDTDGDRVKDAGEIGLSGWRVFIDTDKDGVWDSTEKSVLTDSSGNWSFKGESAKAFTVRVVQQSKFTRTTPTSGSFAFTLAGGQTKTGLLFGQKPIA